MVNISSKEFGYTKDCQKVTAFELCNKSGICLEAFTTEPAVHFYSGNFMHFDSVQKGKNGICYPKHGAFCLEAQHYPDSINHPHFPSTILRPGEVYKQKTVYHFKNI